MGHEQSCNIDPRHLLAGNIYWLKFQRDGKRRYVSLDTSDPVEVITRGSGSRTHCFPDEKTPFLQSVEEYLAEKQGLNLYSRATARVHGAALREFGGRVEGRSLDAIPPKWARDHYEALRTRASEITAQIHIRALRTFSTRTRKLLASTLLRILNSRKSTSQRGWFIAPNRNGIR